MSYSITAVLNVTVHTRVVAETEEEAIEIALNRSVQGLCYKCSGGDAEREWSLTGELDGELLEEDIVDILSAEQSAT